MVEQTDDLPNDVASLKRLVVEQRVERDLAFAALKLKTLEIEKLKLRRMQFGRSSEKLNRAATQLELAIEELETGQRQRQLARVNRRNRNFPWLFDFSSTRHG